MQWYYAHSGQRLGPVGEPEFARLVNEGAIRADTLVWRQGMANWQPYGEVAPSTLPPVPPIPPLPTAAAGPAGMPQTFPVSVMNSGVGGAAQAAAATQPIATPFAGFWIRVVAKIIDLIILAILLKVVGRVMGFVEFDLRALASMSDPAQIAAVMDELGRQCGVQLVIELAYSWIFLKKFAATPGKLALGLKVVRADGSPITTGQIVGRYFASWLCVITLGIGYVVAAFDDEKRGLHDHLAGTRVIKKR
jgi:uncharacterized RDD family membrane protein YckC